MRSHVLIATTDDHSRRKHVNDESEGHVHGIESKVGTSGGDKTEAKTTMKGDLGARYLGVKSIKMIAASCT